MVPLLGAALLVAIVLAAALGARVRIARREQFIRGYRFPPGLFERLAKTRPELEFKDIALTSRALRHFFLAYLKSRRQFVSMPSQVADELWHEFILYTKNYEVFCRDAFGRFLHHTPAIVLGVDRGSNAGLRRTWWWCCREENIDPGRPSRLPLLFALDAKMNIGGGYRYVADCSGVRHDRPGSSAVHCGTDLSDAGFDGSIDGFGDFGGGSHGHGVGDGWGGDGGSGDGGGDGGGGGCGGGD